MTVRIPALLLSRLLALVAALSLCIQPAAAQSVLRDAETEALFRDASAPIFKAAGFNPKAIDLVLLNDGSINAFVAGGQAIYIHSGLISAADNVNELQGVIAHELGHITGGHIIRYNEGLKPATGITVLSLLLGGLAGSPDAALGVFMAGQQAALGKFLAFSRAQESSADAAGAKFLSDAGISGRGSIEFFKKLQNQEFRYGYNASKNPDAEFYSTHPMTSDRLTTLQDVYEKDPAWNTPPPAELQARFQRVKAKLNGYLAEPQDTLRAYPDYMTDIPARYARAYAFHKEAYVDKALAETRALIASDPDNPYFLELEGQILLESGRPADAVAPLRKATQLTGNEPLIATTFGHALIATEDKDNFAEAEKVLKTSASRDRDNPFTWYQLGVVYEAKGDIPRARIASAEQQLMNMRLAEAVRSAEAAEAALPKGTPDWLRAQDIAMSARAMMERQKKSR